MLCPDYTNLSIKGDQNSPQMIMPSISFRIPDKECRNDPYDSECIASKEYEDQMANKAIIMLSNRKRFDQLEYDQNPIINESIFNTIEFPKSNQVILYEI